MPSRSRRLARREKADGFEVEEAGRARGLWLLSQHQACDKLLDGNYCRCLPCPRIRSNSHILYSIFPHFDPYSGGKAGVVEGAVKPAFVDLKSKNVFSHCFQSVIRQPRIEFSAQL